MGHLAALLGVPLRSTSKKQTNNMKSEFAIVVQENEVMNHFGELQWVRAESVLDSGAAESVAPTTMAPWIQTVESDGGRMGANLR